MPKITKKHVSFIDRDGFEWIAGEFTENQIVTWIKRYKAQGIFLSVRTVSMAVAS